MHSPQTFMTTTTVSSDDELFVQTEMKSVIANMHEGSGDPNAYSPPSVTYDQSSDDRKYIAKTFEEGFNSGDPNYFGGIIRNLITTNCICEAFNVRIAPDGTKSEEREIYIEGLEEIVTYYMGYLIAIPDCIFLIHEWKIFNRPAPYPPYSNTHACLGLKFSVTGTKVFDVKVNCHRLVTSETPETATSTTTSSPATTTTAPSHSIQFRERSRTTKYDHRKRGKVLTLGEYVGVNEMPDHQIVNLEEQVTNFELKESMMDVEPDQEQEHVDSGDLYRNAQKVSVHGVLRFYLNEDQKVYKIRCIHIRGGSV